MSLATLYGCEAELANHVCNPCPTDINAREFARVRGVAIIFKDYLPEIKVDPTDPELWLAGISQGKIIIIPDTAGSFDPGDPKELKGYGDRNVSYGPRTQKLSFVDPNFKDNYNFWNNIHQQTGLVLAFRTSSLLHLADVPASIFAKDTVADDLEAEVVWDVSATWISNDLPQLHDATTIKDEIFTCAIAA